MRRVSAVIEFLLERGFSSAPSLVQMERNGSLKLVFELKAVDKQLLRLSGSVVPLFGCIFRPVNAAALKVKRGIKETSIISTPTEKPASVADRSHASTQYIIPLMRTFERVDQVIINFRRL